MPIRADLRPLYPSDWKAISRQVRFGRAGGRCEGCGRPHGATLRCLPCERTWPIDIPAFRCPFCGGSEVEIATGDEFEVESIELQSADEQEEAECIAQR